MRVLVLGATGYVGSRLVPELLGRGHDVVAATRRPGRPGRHPWSGDVTWRTLDVDDPTTLRGALDDVDALAYLVHGLEHRDFRRRDLAAAAAVRAEADSAGLGRLVYLGGIVPDVATSELSEHLLSRFEVEEELLRGRTPTLALRAAVVVGSGSASFEVVRDLSRRIPLLQPVPAWMWGTRVQPVAVADVVHYLAEALVEGHDEGGRGAAKGWLVGSADLAGPDVMTYRELLHVYADVVGSPHLQLPVWGVPPSLVSPVTAALTDVDTTTVESLVLSLEHDMVAEDDLRTLLGDPGRVLVGVREAITRSVVPLDPAHDGAAVGADPMAPSAGD